MSVTSSLARLMIRDARRSVAPETGSLGWILAAMARSDKPAQFVSGNDRLTQILSDPQLRTRVDTIVDEMSLIDRRYRAAVQALDGAVAATRSPIEPDGAAAVLEELQRHLMAAGVREVGITLTFADHEVTVPVHQILAERGN